MSSDATNVARRVGRALSVLFAVYAITFVFIRLTPGNPFANRAPRALSEQAQQQIEAQFSLDDPWYVQFVRYPLHALTGDLGVSYSHQGQAVTDVIADRAGPTASLLLAAIVIGLLVGIPVGVFTALRQNSWLDHTVSTLTTAGVAVPVFVVTPVFVVLFAVYADLLPSQGWDGLLTMTAIIPVVALSLEPIAIIARFTRSSMIEVLQSDHIRTARARGLRHSTVVYRQALKNASIPIVTVTGLEVAALTGSVLFVEQAYNVPGLGSEFLAVITARDYPVILALTLLFSIVIVVANLAVDVSYGHLDPRTAVLT